MTDPRIKPVTDAMSAKIPALFRPSRAVLEEGTKKLLALADSYDQYKKWQPMSTSPKTERKKDRITFGPEIILKIRNPKLRNFYFVENVCWVAAPDDGDDNWLDPHWSRADGSPLGEEDENIIGWIYAPKEGLK